MFLEVLQNSQENTCARVSFIKKETPAQVFSSEFLRNFQEHLFNSAPPHETTNVPIVGEDLLRAF